MAAICMAQRENKEVRFGFRLRPTLADEFRDYAARTDQDLTELIERGIEMVIQGETVAISDDPLLDSFRAPLLTEAPCGPWEEALDHAGHFTISQDAADELEARDGDVFVRAMGDSMEGAGIFDGALLLTRPLINQGEPRRGEIALVQIIDENGDYLATIKRWQPGTPPTLIDGNDEPFVMPERVRQILPVVVVRGIIARI